MCLKQLCDELRPNKPKSKHMHTMQVRRHVEYPNKPNPKIAPKIDEKYVTVKTNAEKKEKCYLEY